MNFRRELVMVPVYTELACGPIHSRPEIFLIFVPGRGVLATVHARR